ncbi:MAG: hypothetical protein LBR26_12770 [Prevotella sp.]|jgi:hypothetical protein|nr:hypothetical protein [Prevotella sp.]
MSKNKIKLLLAIFLVGASVQARQSCRVKSVDAYKIVDGKTRHARHELAYDPQGKMIFITAVKFKEDGSVDQNETVNVAYKQESVSILRSYFHNVKIEVKFDKQGKFKECRNPDYKINYNQDGSVKEYTYREKKYEALYDEHNRLAALINDRSEAVYSNYLVYFTPEGKIDYVQKGVGYEAETIRPVWDGERLVTINTINRFNKIECKHEFVYDDSGKLVEEKIYHNKSFDGEDFSLGMHYKIQYEDGQGNDDVYTMYVNWQANVLFGVRSFFFEFEIKV